MTLFSLRCLAVFAVTLPLSSDVPGRVQTDAMAAGSSPVARIAHGWMYWINDPTPGAFRVYGRDGHLAVARLIPGHSDAELLNLAIEDDGSMAAAWTKKSTPAVSGIDLLDRDGNPKASFGTGKFHANFLDFAPDHSIWAFGWEQIAERWAVLAKEYMTVRHFAADGHPLGSFLPRSTFSKGLAPAGDSWQGSGLNISNSRIGILAWDGTGSEHKQWVELDLDGNLLGTYRLDGDYRWVALLDDGQVIAQLYNTAPLFQLDRASGNWKASAFKAPENAGFLYGADGNQLVFMSWPKGAVVLQRVSVGEQPAVETASKVNQPQ